MMILAGAVRRLDAAVTFVLGGQTLAFVFSLLLLAAAIPIFTDQVPPLTDYINHLARMQVIAGVDTDPLLGKLFEVKWAIIPNLMMDLVVPPLARHLDIYLSGQIFVFLTVLLLVTGPMAVHYALHRRLSPWPLMAFPFVYNGIFLFGFMNYLFGTGVAVWGVAAWIAVRDRAPLVRASVSAAIVVVLFFCHLFAVGLYGMTLLAIECWRLAERRRLEWRSLAVDAAAFLLPFVPVLPLILASPTIKLSHDILWEPSGKLEGLYYMVQLYRDTFDLTFAGLMVAGAVWLARRDLLRLHPAGWTLLTIGALVFLAMPRVLFGSWVSDQRLPVGMVFLMIGFVMPDLRGRSVRAGFYAFLVAVSLARFTEVQVNWQWLGDINAEMMESGRVIPPGAAILVAHSDQPSGSIVLNEALMHVACLNVIERHALVSTLFTVPGKQVLDVREPYRSLVDTEDGDPPTVSQMIASSDEPLPGHAHYWDLWPQRYNFVYVLYTQPGDANPDPDRLALAYEGRQFQLYRVLPDSL